MKNFAKRDSENMETDIYHDCGHRRRNTDKRKKKLTNVDTPKMTTNINTDNEVARLREEVKRWKELFVNFKETPYTPRSEEYVLAGDKKLDGELDYVKEPAPSWRELGQDEVICEGDEYAAIHMGWRAVGEYFLSRPAHAFKPTPFRTRRPLPKKEEERPPEKEQVVDYCRKWADQHLADHGKETFYARLGLLVDFATDFYSDQIEHLKKKQK